MIAVKAIYQDGTLKFEEAAPITGPVEVMVVFPDPEEDPWQRILDDPRPRPALAKMVEEVRKEIAQGKAIPLDLDQL